MTKPSETDIKQMLSRYGIGSFCECKEIDSSRDENDIRWNYIIDKKYVLRYNSANVMTEGRIQEINALVGRYMAEGIKCPKYILSQSGSFVQQWNLMHCYLSEYLDDTLASERESCGEEPWWEEMKDFTAAFAQKYKNVGISDTMSMYSLFELCPYDKEVGIDEKQDNLNELLEAINILGDAPLAKKLADKNTAVRGELQGFYAQLPRCVFQGDENSSNVLVDNEGHFVGLIDFNMSGTDVVVNYLANIVGFDTDGQDFLAGEPEKILEEMLAGYRNGLRRLFTKYQATETERRAAALYAYIVLIASYPNMTDYRYYLQQEKTKEKMQKFLDCAADLDIRRLYV